MKIVSALVALLLSSGAAPAATAVVCAQVEDLLWSIDEIEQEDSNSNGVNAMAVTRLSMRAMQALGTAQAFADEGELPPEIIEGLQTIRDSLRKDADGPDMPFEEARPRILERGIVIATGMPKPCPDAELPDLSAHLD